MNRSQRAVELFNKYALDYQGKYMDVNMYAAGLDYFCTNLLPSHKQILELACGPGNLSKYLLNKRSDLQLLGTDLSENMLTLAQLNNPKGQFQLLDARHVLTLNRSFDGMVCGFCLPYLAKEETKKLIIDAGNMLTKQGLLYLSTMEDDYSTSGLRKGSQGDEIFMHFYKEEDLQLCLKEAHLTPVYVERVITEMTNGTKVVDLVIIAKK